MRRIACLIVTLALATLLHYYGDAVRDFIERRLTLVTSAVAAGIVGGFLALKLL